MSISDWCEPLLDASQMRAVDRWAIEGRGIPSLDLMERAGIEVARAVERTASDGPVVVVCGKGNNGGDGLVAARILREAGRSVTAVLISPLDELSRDAAVNCERLPGEPPISFGESAARESIAGASVLIDSLLGTGFSGAPHGTVAEAIDAVNLAPGAVVSVDIPSGVDASSGEVEGAAVWADATVTFHKGKPGLWIHPGKLHAGHATTVDIGIPKGAPGQPDSGLIGPGVLELLPRRTLQSTKLTSGHVVLIGGSPGLMGAPAMSALAAMRAGAGYVTACVPASLSGVLDTQLMEVMTRVLPDEDGSLGEGGAEFALETLERADALALGPGLGRADGAASLARAIARMAPLPLVLDADGLNAHVGHLDDLAGRKHPTVLTPHTGELGRLLGLPSAEIERARLSHARRAAARSGSVVVLKGDDTLIADPSGRVAISPGDSPALATAGAGDVLTGAIAALLAQGLDAFTAAAAGVYLHREAGREASARIGGNDGVIASDVIAALPSVRRGKRA